MRMRMRMTRRTEMAVPVLHAVWRRRENDRTADIHSQSDTTNRYHFHVIDRVLMRFNESSDRFQRNEHRKCNQK